MATRRQADASCGESESEFSVRLVFLLQRNGTRLVHPTLSTKQRYVPSWGIIGAAAIALRDKGPKIVAGTGRKLTFGSRDSRLVPSIERSNMFPIKGQKGPSSNLDLSSELHVALWGKVEEVHRPHRIAKHQHKQPEPNAHDPFASS